MGPGHTAGAARRAPLGLRPRLGVVTSTVEEDRLVEETLAHSMSALEAFLDQLPVLLDFEPGRIVLGGFSQGGTTSMAFAISRPSTVAAVINFSGFLTESVEVPFSALSPGAPPIFM